jgi:hypothetical protein
VCVWTDTVQMVSSSSASIFLILASMDISMCLSPRSMISPPMIDLSTCHNHASGSLRQRTNTNTMESTVMRMTVQAVEHYTDDLSWPLVERLGQQPL